MTDKSVISGDIVKQTHILEDWRSDHKKRTKVMERLRGLFRTFERLRVGIGWQNVQMNDRLLAHSVYSYFLDIDRHKDFHRIELANEYRRAAFTAKWLTLTKPIQVLQDPQLPSTEETVFFANEYFAIVAAIAHLNVDLADVPPSLIRRLVYDMHFRPIIAETWIIEFYLFECAALGNKPKEDDFPLLVGK